MEKSINEPLNPPYQTPRPEGFEESPCMENLIKGMNYMNFELPPGPGLLPFAYVLNFNKATMFIYLYALMVYFDNFSTGAWIYLALHGSYGFFWVFKDTVFPDPGF